VTLVSGINFLNQAFHLATHALAGFPKLHHKCSAHSEFRIWLVSASARGYSVEFTWILCRRWKTDAVARTVNGSGNRGPLSVGAAEEQRRKSVHAVLGLRCGETIFEANRMTIVRSPYLLVEGPLQKYEGVIHVQARKIEAINLSAGAASSHDFK
jgi:hypothetical protein